MVDVLFVAPDLHRGGVGRCVAFIVDALPEQGMSTALFCLRSLDSEFSVRNPRVARALPLIQSDTLFRFMLPIALWRLIRNIRQERPAIVCSHGLVCNILVAVAKTLTRGKFRSVAFEHSSPSIHYSTTRFSGIKRWLLNHTYHRHDAIVGVSRGVAQDLETMFPALAGKCRHIYNGIALDEVRRQSGSPPAPPAATGPRHVVSVGRLDSAKDYGTLIEAAAILDDPDITFTILGEGPERAALQRLIDARAPRTRVILAGHVDNPFPIVARAAAFVLTSRRESFGNALVEALTLGVPVVATNCPYGPAEILDEGRYGLLVPVGDAPALAHALRRLVDDPVARARLSAIGPERANAFSLDRHCHSVIDLFYPLLTRQHA